MKWKDYIGCGLILLLASLGVTFALGMVVTQDARLAGMAACRAICADDKATAIGGEGRVVKCSCPKAGGKAELERP